MCGFVVCLGKEAVSRGGDASLDTLRHRGPDARGLWSNPSGSCLLGHHRLSIIDLSDAGRQPMKSADGRYHLVFNGEIYNYLELRADLSSRWSFTTATDTEVLLAAFSAWGPSCLGRLTGMFSFALWDEEEKTLFAARDRFGVKPFYYAEAAAGLVLASEIKALHGAGIPAVADERTWSDYLVRGLYDHGESTFWEGIRQVPPGGTLTWSPAAGLSPGTWYDPAAEAMRLGPDERDDGAVADELLALLEESVRLRFRSDVPVGVCLSGGLDSSILFALVRKVRGDHPVKTFTFECGDDRYDETPWVRQLTGDCNHSFFARLEAGEVPRLAAEVQKYQDEPFGGLPTLGMAGVHRAARREGVVVLLDGNGMDEGWAGYDYYARAAAVDAGSGPVQGSKSPSTRADCLKGDFAALSPGGAFPRPFSDPLPDLQYRDIRFAKIPRAMRFADRVSMMYSRELREPFLDQRIIELGLRQPVERKIRDGQGKWLVRRVASTLLPGGIREAPKRPVQTPQREWLRDELADWVGGRIDAALAGPGRRWLDEGRVRNAWRDYREGGADNSFPLWQWVSLGLMTELWDLR